MAIKTYTILVTETVTHKVNVQAASADEANELYCSYEGDTDIVSEPYGHMTTWHEWEVQS
jgi:hypothetical protein